MAVLAQVFTGTHADALARADALDAGQPAGAGPHVDLGVTPYDLDDLGQIVARVVRFGSGETEPLEIDLEHERLFELPEFWCEALAELAVAEDPEALDDVAQEWADTDEMADAGDLAPLVRDLVAVTVGARKAGVGVYLWVAEA
jgi:hypothetical protein